MWILGVASLLTDISSEMIHGVLPLFLVSTLGASTLMIGLIDGAGEAIASCLKLFSGAFSDYIRQRKPLLIAGYGLSTLVKPLFAIAANPYVVLLARCLDRTGKGIRAAPRDALIADVTEPSIRGAAYGLRQSLDSVGALIGPAIAFAILATTNNDFRLVFWIAVAPAVLTVILLAVGIHEPASKTAAERKNPLSREAIRSLGKEFWIIFSVALVFTLGNSSDSFLLLKLKEAGAGLQFIPLAFVLMNIVYAASAYPAGKLSDIMGRKRLLMFSFALYAGIYAGLAYSSSIWQVWALLALYGLYLGFSQGILSALTADKVPPELRGTAFGLLNLAIGLGLLPANLLGGWLWEGVSSRATFLAGALFSALALVFLGVGLAEKKAAD